VIENMGNCLKTPTTDDISLLRGSDSQSDSHHDTSDLGPPPPYQVRFYTVVVCHLAFVLCLYFVTMKVLCVKFGTVTHLFGFTASEYSATSVFNIDFCPNLDGGIILDKVKVQILI
jgi:hypothetical protein